MGPDPRAATHAFLELPSLGRQTIRIANQSGDLTMSNQMNASEPKMWVESSANQIWVDPEIRELNVRETFAFPGVGADAGGNPFPDCQLS